MYNILLYCVQKVKWLHFLKYAHFTYRQKDLVFKLVKLLLTSRKNFMKIFIMRRSEKIIMYLISDGKRILKHLENCFEKFWIFLRFERLKLRTKRLENTLEIFLTLSNQLSTDTIIINIQIETQIQSSEYYEKIKILRAKTFVIPLTFSKFTPSLWSIGFLNSQ